MTDEIEDFVDKAGRMGIFTTPENVHEILETLEECNMPAAAKTVKEQIISEENVRIKKMVANAQARGIPLTEDDVMKAVEAHRESNPGQSILDQVAEEIQHEIEGGAWEPTVIAARENTLNRAQRRAMEKRRKRYQGPDRKRHKQPSRKRRG